MKQTLSQFMQGIPCHMKIKIVNTFNEPVLNPQFVEEDYTLTVEELQELQAMKKLEALFNMEIAIPRKYDNSDVIEVMVVARD